jgi:hypothetical protein
VAVDRVIGGLELGAGAGVCPWITMKVLTVAACAE